METLDLGFPANAVPSRRQLINNNSVSVVQISNFKVYPDLDPTVYDVLPKMYYTVYVSGSKSDASETREYVNTLPIVFTMDLFVGPDSSDVVPLHGTLGPRGVRTLSNDIQYYHYHEMLGLDASSQSVSGIPPSYGTDGSKKDSQSGLNSFYHLNKVNPFLLPKGIQLFMDLSATQADTKGLIQASSAFVKDYPDYDSSVGVFYHEGQQVNGAFQYIELHNSALANGQAGSKSTSDAIVTISFDYGSPGLPSESGFTRVKLTGSSYEPSSGEVSTSSGEFITLIQNAQYTKFREVEGREYPSGKGDLTITKLLLYSSEYNASEKAVYDLYKMRGNGVFEPLLSRVPVYASSNELPVNTMQSILSGTSALDLVETMYDSLNFETVRLAHRTRTGLNDGEAIVAVCRDNSLAGGDYQTLAVYYEGYYEQEGGYKITSQTGREYHYNHSAGDWVRG